MSSTHDTLVYKYCWKFIMIRRIRKDFSIGFIEWVKYEEAGAACLEITEGEWYTLQTETTSAKATVNRTWIGTVLPLGYLSSNPSHVPPTLKWSTFFSLIIIATFTYVCMCTQKYTIATCWCHFYCLYISGLGDDHSALEKPTQAST